MRKFLLVISAVLFTQVAFAADGLNIAFVDGTAIMKKYESPIEDKLRSEFKDQEAELTKIQKKLQSDGETYKRDSAMMSDAEKLAFQQNFEKQQMELQKLGTEFNQLRMKRMNEELEKLLDKVKAVVKKISVDKKYDAVLQLGATIYADERLDITNDVLAQLDKK